MASSRKTKETWEFGDFQTPNELAVQVVGVLQQLGINPVSIVEPTCGTGNLLTSAIKSYPHTERYIGADINSAHLKKLREKIITEGLERDVDILHANFFDTDWNMLLSTLPQPILVIGNPPWVTSSELSALQSSNLPEKSNFHGRNGLDALTGKSNFDISEWMLLQHLTWLQDKNGVIAMLCKTAVARKILIYAWQKKYKISSSKIFKIDAKKYFNASVDASLLVMQFNGNESLQRCSVFNTLTDHTPTMILGSQDDFVLSNVTTYQSLRHILGEDKHYTWRSGIKHDCSKVMELVQEGDSFVNGNGIIISLEDDFVYPLLKSSDIGNNRLNGREKYMLVTQRYIGEDTSKIKMKAPRTWDYLQNNRDALAGRGSSIYKNRPDFSIFGVGDYTFAPWKVAISGFYKRLNFVVIPPIHQKPVVFDDTVYFLSCATQQEADYIAGLLNSNVARDFLDSMIFWEDKRPITIEILKRLHLQSLARSLGSESEYLAITKHKGVPNYSAQVTQLRLIEQRKRYR
ncbi:MAG: N-6 DNA methylase [Chloroflexales bacterium]|nr:N-6 DNA methylase [Chloroflexales bacterium]